MQFQVLLSLWSVTSCLCMDKIPDNYVKKNVSQNKRLIHELEWSKCSCSRFDNSAIQMNRLERVSREQNSQELGDLVSAHTTDAAKSMLRMSNFRINYCNWKSYLAQNCQLFLEIKSKFFIQPPRQITSEGEKSMWCLEHSNYSNYQSGKWCL